MPGDIVIMDNLPADRVHLETGKSGAFGREAHYTAPWSAWVAPHCVVWGNDDEAGEMNDDVAKVFLAVLKLSGNNYSIEFSAVDDDGDDLVFDENGEFLSSRSTETSWDDPVALPPASDLILDEPLIKKINRALERIRKFEVTPSDEYESGAGPFSDLWIDVYGQAGHFIINATDGQVMRET